MVNFSNLYQQLPGVQLYIMQAVQREREEKLARSLKSFLNQYVQGDKEGFLWRAESEARRLSGAGQLSFIPPLQITF